MADPHGAHVLLLLNAEAPATWSGAGNYDLSWQRNVLTLGGNATRSAAQAKYGTYSIAFDGVGDQLWCYLPQALGAADFTLEMWVYPITGGHGDAWARILQIGAAGTNGTLALVCSGTENPAKLQLHGVSSGAWFDLCPPGAAISNDTWHHVAITKNGTAWTLWVDGAAYSTGTYAYAVTENRFSLGSNWNTSECFKGYIDDFRMTLHVPRYSTAFTPPGALEVPSVADLVTADPAPFGNPDAAAGSARNETPYHTTLLCPSSVGLAESNDRHFYCGGLGVIASTVKEKATPSDLPLARLVRLFTQREGLLVAATWSDPVTGVYRFENLDPSLEYFAVADDHERIYRSVIASNLVPE